MPRHERDDESTVGKEVEDGYRRKVGKYEADDVRNRIPWEPVVSRGMTSEWNTDAPMMIPNVHIPIVERERLCVEPHGRQIRITECE